MSQVFGIALSGMQAATTQLDVAANNIANADTPGYKASRADLVELSTDGVGVAGISKDPAPGPLQPDGKEGSNVDLAGESINLTRAQILYSANAAVIKIGNRMTGTLLNMMDSDRRDNN
jgi:flagellar hook protein FlgE